MNYEPGNMEIRACATCNSDMEPVAWHQRFCSTACRMRDYRKRRKQRTAVLV